jgi:hypothetical protein
MSSTASLRLLAAAILGAAPIGAARAANESAPAAAHHFDGKYVVNITTKHGSCHKHNHWMILISGGRISSVGDTPMNASGHINPHGIVHLMFKRFHHHATVTGRLIGRAGSGSWHSPSLECTGSWHAHRLS